MPSGSLDRPLKEIVWYVGKWSGTKLTVAEDLRDLTISLRLVDVTPEEILDGLCRAYGLRVTRNAKGEGLIERDRDAAKEQEHDKVEAEARPRSQSASVRQVVQSPQNYLDREISSTLMLARIDTVLPGDEDQPVLQRPQQTHQCLRQLPLRGR